MSEIFKLKIEKSGIAVLEFNLIDEKVNILRSDVLIELEKQIDKISKDKKIKILIIKSAKKDNFIAGADINEIKSLNSKKDVISEVSKGQNILTKIEKLPCITLAYIHGTCLGGGTELALCCDYRVSSDDAKTLIGLPEVNLGIIPGFGGTQRLPKLVGLMNSLPMILTGKPINYKKAYRIGLVDGYFPKEYEKVRLYEFTNKLLNSATRKQIIKRRKKLFSIEKIGYFREIIFRKAKKNIIKKTQGKYPAPLNALKVVKYTYNTNITRGLKLELEYFSKLVVGDICKNLINLYFINEKVKKESWVAGKIKIKNINNAGVIGSGIMGGGIAWFYTKLNVPVRMKDINWHSIAIGYQQIYKIYKTLLKIKKLTKSQMDSKISLVTATTDMRGFENCDIVSEAVVEDILLKKKVFTELENHLSQKCIIASNTSSLSINNMSEKLKYPDRFIGMHFFNPVNRMPLVEVIPGENTAKETIATTVSLIKKSGKTPIVVKDGAGFLVNRILLTYINEAFYILDEIGDIKRVDKLIENFGMPMGPFTLSDTVGLDVGYKVAATLESGFGARMKVSSLITKIYKEHNLLGKKGGVGFYVYHKKKSYGKVGNIIQSVISAVNGRLKSDKVEINDDIRNYCSLKTKHMSDNIIIDRLILIMINEAARCLAEKVVKSAEYLDLAMIMGTGFPPYRGGLLKYADDRGIGNIVKDLKSLAKDYGDKFTPCDYLLDLHKKKKGFYTVK